MTTNRLSRNFHCTFKPERQYINALLRYAASGRSGNFKEIANATGIPMGESSGKVPAILNYCRGMGLIKFSNSLIKTTKKKPKLTDFGRIVFKEDPFLKFEITQWIVHFNLCNPVSGADVWFYTFFSGYNILGNIFKRSDLENHLSLQLGKIDSGIIGPMIGMYEDEAAFGKCGVLSEQKGEISRKSAPIFDELIRGYASWILQLMKDFFPDQQQIPITDLDKIAGWKLIPGWTESTSIRILDLIESKGLIKVDRQMKPWLIKAQTSADLSWKDIYNDMI